MDDAQTKRWIALGRMNRKQLAALHWRFVRETGTITLIPKAPFHTWKKHDMISYFMWGGAETWDWTRPAAEGVKATGRTEEEAI